MPTFVQLTLRRGEAFYVNPDQIARIFDTRDQGGYGRPASTYATLVLSNEIHYELAGTATEIINYITAKTGE